MKRWEYDTVDNLDITSLDRMGAKGWELVCVNRGTAYFKREVAVPAEVETGARA